MRLNVPLPLIALFLSPLLLAQEPEGAGTQVKNLLPYQKAFLNLPAEKREAFINQQREASRLFSEKRVIETLEQLKLTEALFADSPDVWNLRGSCYVELRAFDKALYCFRKAAEVAGKNVSIQFNIGEVYFVTHEWQMAHDIFEGLLKELTGNQSSLVRITEFKVLLCKLKINQEQQARILAEKYDYLDDSPYYYFAKAALAYHKGDIAEAEQWVARAARIFRDPAILAPWHDTLVEYGYIKSFYGDNE